ncbi:uncharacterized protein LOC34617895 [Cyclospora cayetanensis]|uniref:Uncharacterized protein LOC34617895 n=1 Tax=Cyclospora cayetanensis TaxID=88456 RepID=A0A6P6RUL3_9EIME|nr:uncharacterized protein LOC34617895 [Cyclospora cayetanensis]
MFKRKSQKAAQIDTTGPKELVDTVVPKMTVEEQLKFVDLEFVQEVEKFVEVPEVFYNDVIVEVPQVIEVIKVVPKEEIRENITYVPRFETKYIPKYVEVPIIKIVDRYEEVDEIHEILKPVVKKSVVDYEDVPVYKIRQEPKIIKEDMLNNKPHFIDIPVPFERPVVKYVDQPYFVNRYRDHLVPIPMTPSVRPIFRQGQHTQPVEVPIPAPYLVTHTAHSYHRPVSNYPVGSSQMQAYRQRESPRMPTGQYGVAYSQTTHVGEPNGAGVTPRCLDTRVLFHVTFKRVLAC